MLSSIYQYFYFQHHLTLQRYIFEIIHTYITHILIKSSRKLLERHAFFSEFDLIKKISNKYFLYTQFACCFIKRRITSSITRQINIKNYRKNISSGVKNSTVVNEDCCSDNRERKREGRSMRIFKWVCHEAVSGVLRIIR